MTIRKIELLSMKKLLVRKKDGDSEIAKNGITPSITKDSPGLIDIVDPLLNIWTTKEVHSNNFEIIEITTKKIFSKSFVEGRLLLNMHSMMISKKAFGQIL